MYVGADPADTPTLTGHPNISLTIPAVARRHATASVVVNSIPGFSTRRPACERRAICRRIFLAKRPALKTQPSQF
jgi:hypothetical protein